jgi:acyl-CoA synthetase (NDP forming)
MLRVPMGVKLLSFDFDEIAGIINARSLAIVGASGAPMKFGSFYTSAQLQMEFDGPLYLVNPHEKEIMGRKVYPDLKSLPETPDVVALTIPAHRSIEMLRDCAELGVKGVIMIASGFREIGSKGIALEKEALELAREGGFRIVGPNCFGIYNPRNRMTVLPGYDFSKSPGRIAFISQSGGYSVHVARQAQSLGLGFSAVVSYGNAADLNETDFLRYFTLDGHTDIIAGYLEGVMDGDGFPQALAEASAVKPVVLWKVGRSESSRRAVASHTGSMAGSSEIWEGLIRQHEVIPASGVDEMVDILLALEHFGRRPGRRLLMASGGGGIGTYAGDIAEAEGLSVPPLEGECLERMRVILSRAGAVAGNPLDIGAPLIPLPEFEGAMREAASNHSTDILVFDLAINFGHDLAGEPGLDLVGDILIRIRRETGKPLAVVLYSRSFDPDKLVVERILRRMRSKLLEQGIPVYPSIPRALRAIARVNI